ncbi:N-acetylneuraminate synthase family protein [Flavivirga rizhaonensis]|uniref:N-acetylneuraminate synthase n=1 Tax=Flavivirga rizhaonensis TaxID=2559571 RepID=A0A4S1E1M4_9FLAO|nr:N-acetylneuraminate synthase family protein [Flavivirga rizhaonensis]TGV03848.1 N-acetylneuraminate synthase [Flavivirga rizhaonensis]
MKKEIKIGKHTIGDNHPTYFIADIAANHDGDIERAKLLIKLAKESGADAVKFQHHDVKKYVSDYGFKNLGGKFSHQSKWDKSIFEVYKDAEVPRSWTEELKDYCDELDITFFTTPYDLDTVDYINKYVPAFKIGSGDVAWHAMLEKIAKTNKPVLFATGASNMQEVINAVNILKPLNNNIILMQCNTNYTGSDENFKYINLNVLEAYKTLFPDIILGLSDHTHGGVTVLGGVALGAKVIEKHFTDDTTRKGPDHPFSTDPKSWRKMVDDTRLLESAMGNCIKKVEENEEQTVILQRRAIRVIQEIKEGEEITMNKIQFQRPSPADAFDVNQVDKILGKKAKSNIQNGDYIRLNSIEW